MQGKKHLRVTILPSLLCLLAMLISACGGSNTTSTTNNNSAASADKQVLRYADAGISDFATLDPALVQDASDAVAIQAIFTGLVSLNDKGEVQDQLAAKHSVSSDGTKYTFDLKPNLTFSNGDPLTADDVAYSINRTLDPATKSEVTSYVSSIKDSDQLIAGKIKTLIGDSIIVNSPTSITLVVSSPIAYFLNQLAYPTSYVVNKKLVTQYSDKWTDHLGEGGGAGPFKVASYSHSTGLDLVPNDKYYNAKPKLAHFKILLSGDADTSYHAYHNGQYDWVTVPANDLPDARKYSDLHTFPLLVIRYLSFNLLAKPFDNVHIRQAFALAINKDLIVKSVLADAHTPTDRYIPSGMYGATSTPVTGPAGVTATTGDQAKAKELLKQGMQEEGITTLPAITFDSYTKNAAIAKVTSAIIDQWKTVLGATATARYSEFSALVKAENDTTHHSGPLQVWIGGWQADYPDPQDWLSIFFGVFEKGASYNSSNFGQNTSADAKAQQAIQDSLAKADVTLDVNQRAKLYNDAEQQIADQAPWIPLYQQNGHEELNSKVKGWPFDALDYVAPDDWANIYVTA